MILNKENLLVSGVIGSDKSIPILNNVHITIDGSTVSANTKSVLVVSPAAGSADYTDSLEQWKEPMTVPAESVKGILKDLPAGNECEISHSVTTKGNINFHVAIDLEDSIKESGSKYINGKKFLRGFIDFMSRIKNVFGSHRYGKQNYRLILNKRRLLLLLDTINKICPDSSGETAVYLETVENDCVIRCLNRTTKQVACGVMKGEQDSEWMEYTQWERKFYGIDKPVRKRVKREGKDLSGM